MVRPIPFGYFRSYAYQPMMPYQYQSYYPNYYNPYMTFPQLLTNIPSRKSQNIGKISETIDEKGNSRSSTTTTTTTTTAQTPTESVSITTSTIPSVSTSSVSQKIQLSTEDSVPNSNAEPMDRMDHKYFDNFQRIPSWTFRHNDIRAEQQPSVESQLKNTESKQKIQFVPCMCPVSVGTPIPISIGAAEAADRFTENKIRRFEDLGESDIEDFTETHL